MNDSASMTSLTRHERDVLPLPQTIIIWRGASCWMANVPDWKTYGVPLPFMECAPAAQVKEHLRRLHPNTRIVFEEEAR